LLLYRHDCRPVESRKHEGTVAVDQGNTRWCSDGFEIGCDNGEKVRVAFALDCCDREVMSWVATTKGIDANLVGDLMMQAVEYRFGASQTAPHEVEWRSLQLMDIYPITCNLTIQRFVNNFSTSRIIQAALNSVYCIILYRLSI